MSNLSQQNHFSSALKKHLTVKKMVMCAMLMALYIVCCSFSIPVPGGHLYLNDVVICVAGIIFDPVAAFTVGGLGAFLGDLFFYPATMFVSLVIHGVQAVVISLISHRTMKTRPVLASSIAVTAGAVIMVAGYTLSKAYIYGPAVYGGQEAAIAAAIAKLPYETLQAGLGAVLGMLLCFKYHLTRHRRIYSEAKI